MKKNTIQSIKKFNKLIKGIAEGKKDALENFYSLYGKLIYSVAMTIVKSSFLADEVVNDVLIKIWQKSSTLKKIEKPVSWLCSVTKNCARDSIRTKKLSSEIYDIPKEDKNIEEFLNNDIFLSYILHLNEDEQQIMILYFIQCMSFKMIAKEICKPQSTISSIYYRSLKKIENLIENF